MSDIVVIGGGIAGVSVAAALAPHAEVTLLEAEDALGYHASGRSAAMFLENYGNDAVCALNRASAAHHREARVLSKRGVMSLGRPDQEEIFRAELAEMGMEEISVEEACAWVPIIDRDATQFVSVGREAMDLDTDLLLQSYAKSARANGAKLVFNARVDSIEFEDDGWHVFYGDEKIVAGEIVNAAGAWAVEMAAIAGLAWPELTPYRRSIARTSAPDSHDVSGWPMLHGVSETWYAKPDAGAWLISPAEEDPVEPQDAWADDMVLAEGIARYEEMVTTPVTRLLTSWAGLRTFAPDRTPVIGRDPGSPTFFWLAGQGGYGFQTAPAAAALARDLIVGKPPELDDATIGALSPWRFY